MRALTTWTTSQTMALRDRTTWTILQKLALITSYCGATRSLDIKMALITSGLGALQPDSPADEPLTPAASRCIAAARLHLVAARLPAPRTLLLSRAG